MAPLRDHYDVLGVSRTATQEEIKTAFRKLAMELHPDRNPGDQAADRFKELNASYQVLSDPKRRAMYDRFGDRAEAPGSPFGAGGPFAGGVVDLNDIAVDGILGDLLSVFGVGRGEKGDLKTTLPLTFEEAAFGCEKEHRYERRVTCAECAGGGAAEGTSAEICDACGGRGRVRLSQGFFPIAVEKTCARCKGGGKFVRSPCSACHGAGLVLSENRVRVVVPPGAMPGSVRLVPGGGHRPRPDKPYGDLEVVVDVSDHPFFRREGDDVVCEVPISFAQAALGAEVEIPTLEGRGKLRVPPGTQPGTVLRVRGKGIPRAMGRGDQRVHIALEVPRELSARQRELIMALAEESSEVVAPEQSNFLDKLKSLFG